MIPNEEKGGWHLLAVKKIFILNIIMIFIVWIVSIPLEIENKLKSHEKVRKNKDFCGIVMSSEKDKILEFKQYMKSDKMPYII